jgi:hypothetical protein
MIPFNKADAPVINGAIDISSLLNRVIISAVRKQTRLIIKPALQIAERFLQLITPNEAVRPDANTKIEYSGLFSHNPAIRLVITVNTIAV